MKMQFEDVESLHQRMRLWYGVCFVLASLLSALEFACGVLFCGHVLFTGLLPLGMLIALMVVSGWQWQNLRTANSHVKKGLSNMLFVDSLTKVCNSRYISERLEYELALASRRRQALSVLYMDLDNFKTVNDTLGHEAGDDVLEQFGLLLRRCIRETDVVGRIGGDEFVVILPDTPAEKAKKLGERIRSIALSHPFQYRGKRLPVGVSVGLSTYPDHTRNREQLLSLADNAMYQAKKEGKKSRKSQLAVAVAPSNGAVAIARAGA